MNKRLLHIACLSALLTTQVFAAEEDKEPAAPAQEAAPMSRSPSTTTLSCLMTAEISAPCACMCMLPKKGFARGGTRTPTAQASGF